MIKIIYQMHKLLPIELTVDGKVGMLEEHCSCRRPPVSQHFELGLSLNLCYLAPKMNKACGHVQVYFGG